MTDTTRDFEVLDRLECYKLIENGAVGRLVMAAQDGPLVFPVNYVLDGKAIVFRTALGTKLSLLSGPLVSFEIDEIDLARRTGWSVLIRGVAYEATHWESAHLQVESWAPGPKEHWVRVVPRHISGRRITLPEPIFDTRREAGYI